MPVKSADVAYLARRYCLLLNRLIVVQADDAVTGPTIAIRRRERRLPMIPKRLFNGIYKHIDNTVILSEIQLARL